MAAKRGGGSESTSLSTSKSDSSTYRIKVVKREIAHQQADVLVNTTSSNLNLSQGAVSASLLAAGGQQLQAECTKIYPNGIKPGEIAITGPGELYSFCVFHGCLPNWTEDGSNISILKTFMSSCLSEAAGRSLESIAFPALGTGALKYPKDLVAREMFSCVSDFFAKNTDTSLVDVHFVIYKKDKETFKAFKNEEKVFLKRLSPTKQKESVSGKQMKQRKASVSEITPQWDPNDSVNLRLIPLQPTSKEYADVATHFMATVRLENTSATVPIVKIERIQNRTLHAQYQSKKKLINKMNPGQTNEMDLWHGTARHAVDSINVYGFNRSLCGKNATLYGDGVYFAKESYYSARDLYSPPDHEGNKRLYLSKVLTGKYALGTEGMRVPPPLVIGQPELHDSVVNDVKSPFIFVIFHDTQAYPEYLITFKWN